MNFLSHKSFKFSIKFILILGLLICSGFVARTHCHLPQIFTSEQIDSRSKKRSLKSSSNALSLLFYRSIGASIDIYSLFKLFYHNCQIELQRRKQITVYQPLLIHNIIQVPPSIYPEESSLLRYEAHCILHRGQPLFFLIAF